MLSVAPSGATATTRGRDGPESAPRRLRLPPRPLRPTGRPRQVTSRPGRRVSLLPEGGSAVGWLLGVDEQRYGFDQGQVGERLREVAHVLAGAGVDLLGVKLQRPRSEEHTSELQSLRHL